jgi:hypothetical protein
MVKDSKTKTTLPEEESKRFILITSYIYYIIVFKRYRSHFINESMGTNTTIRKLPIFTWYLFDASRHNT